MTTPEETSPDSGGTAFNKDAQDSSCLPCTSLSGSVSPARWKLIVAAALFVLYAVLAFVTNEIPDTASMGGDSGGYQSMAVNFARGHGLTAASIFPIEEYAFRKPYDPLVLARLHEAARTGRGRWKFHRTPVYPFVLGLIYRAAGVRPGLAMAVQLLSLVVIAALLPLLGEHLAGTRGFAAGIIGGLAFVLETDRYALRILTEWLIALACFVVLVAWVYMNRRPSGRARSVLFGLSMAFGVLVKGSLIFLPPLFLGYMLARRLGSKAYDRTAIVACLVAFALPVAAYSACASVKTGSFIFVASQGGKALLEGNNEGTLVSGRSSRQFREDPDSFYYKARKADPDRSAVSLVIGFYLSRPLTIPRVIFNKLGAGFNGAYISVSFMVVCFLYSAIRLAQELIKSDKVRYAAVLLLLLGTALFGFRVRMHLAAWAIVTAAGCWNASFRGLVLSVWRHPARAGLVVLMLNFLLVTLVFLGEARYVAPGYFVFSFAGALLAIRLVERIEYLPGRCVGRGGPD